MSAAQHDPEKEDLYVKLADGGKNPIHMDEKVDLGNTGIEKFRILPKKLTDGRGQQAPAPLTEEDSKTLNELGNEWELTGWNGNLLLIIRSWLLPVGYNVNSSDVAFVVPVTYPSAQLDMFYFKTPLHRIDGKQINALTDENFNGEIWQRWSRHRDASSQWKPGIDDLASHIILLEKTLINELVR